MPGGCYLDLHLISCRHLIPYAGEWPGSSGRGRFAVILARLRGQTLGRAPQRECLLRALRGSVVGLFLVLSGYIRHLDFVSNGLLY